MKAKLKIKRCVNALDIFEAILYFATRHNNHLFDLIGLGRMIDENPIFFSSEQIWNYVEESVLPNLSNREIRNLEELGIEIVEQVKQGDNV